MSTPSELYHCFGLGVVECLRTSYGEGKVVFHVRHGIERLRCPVCHSGNIRRRGCLQRDFLLPPIGSKPAVAHFTVQRVECRDCGALRQEHLSFAQPFCHYTRQFARYVLELSAMATVRDVAEYLGVSWGLVRAIQQAHLEQLAGQIRLRDIRYLAIDELAIGKGHRYVSVVMDLERGAIVYVGEGKGAEAVTPFLEKLKRLGVVPAAVAMDMSAAYTSAVARLLPQTAIVFDHFHVVKLMNEKLSVLRRQVQNDAAAQGKKVLKGSRWVLLKNPENLKPEWNEPARLEEALRLNQPLATAYYLKEDLRQIWGQKTREAAEQLLDDWIARARASEIQGLKQMALTLQRHRLGILNYYDHPISTGPLEGMNNKAQTMKRQAYGYRNLHFYKLKLMTLHLKKYALVG